MKQRKCKSLNDWANTATVKTEDPIQPVLLHTIALVHCTQPCYKSLLEDCDVHPVTVSQAMPLFGRLLVAAA